MPENWTVWKSDNQGVKGETFTQTSRKGGDRQLGGEDWRTWQGDNLHTGWPHIRMQINQEEQRGSKIDHATQGSSVGK